MKKYGIKANKSLGQNFLIDNNIINKMTEKLKPLFIAGVLIALQDEDFSNDYDKITTAYDIQTQNIKNNKNEKQ